MHSKIFSATTIGIDAHSVEVEVDLSFGMLQFNIVGLPDIAIKESRQRIMTALKNSGIKLPERKITVNLAPADLKKEGTLFDLPIAIGILQAAQYVQLSKEFLRETLFLGELSLDGSIRSIKGALAIACDAKKLHAKRIVLPQSNSVEAALIEDIEIIGVEHLVQLSNYLRNETTIARTKNNFVDFLQAQQTSALDYSQVKGQQQAKRALQIAAAGRHHILFIGPPGSGKTMLAKRLPSIMPKMIFDEILQTSKIYSVSGKLTSESIVYERPFRNPHHTVSQAGLVGGGSFPQPGEISLTHNGILFLDELTEFKRSTLEVLRQPLENKTVCISRANYSVTFPASFLLVVALNPCPCGYLGDAKKQCTCSQQTIATYLQKLSGPLLDRIDLQVNVQSLDYDTMKNQDAEAVSSQALYKKIATACALQDQRFNKPNKYNAHMNPEEIEQYCVVEQAGQELIKKAFNNLNMTMRGYHKLLKISRTIADLENSSVIKLEHVREALFYRSLDRTLEQMKSKTL